MKIPIIKQIEYNNTDNINPSYQLRRKVYIKQKLKEFPELQRRSKWEEVHKATVESAFNMDLKDLPYDVLMDYPDLRNRMGKSKAEFEVQEGIKKINSTVSKFNIDSIRLELNFRIPYNSQLPVVLELSTQDYNYRRIRKLLKKYRATSLGNKLWKLS